MKKIISLLVTAILGIGLFNQVLAQSDVSKAEAMFIYNFTRYVEWPANNNNSFVISVYGSSQVFNELKQYTNEKLVGAQTIVLKKIAKAEEIDNCQLLFIASSKIHELKSIKSKLNKTLIVTEKDGALEDGAAINFVLNEDKLGYEIKPSNATTAGLKLNSLIVNYAKRTKS